MATKRTATDWSGNVGNDRRHAKMRTLTLDDDVWAFLGELAERLQDSRSGVVELLVIREKRRLEKKSGEGA